MRENEQLKPIKVGVKRENMNDTLSGNEIEVAEKILSILSGHEIPSNSINFILDTCKSVVNNSAFLNDFEMLLVSQIVGILCDGEIKNNSANAILNTCKELLLYNPNEVNANV